MDTDAIKVRFEQAVNAMVRSDPIIGLVASVLLESTKVVEKASQSGELSKLEEEAKRQEISLHMAKIQSQVAQELAIAHRIENAEEVEIEEYYESTGKGGAGISTAGVSSSLSVGAEGRKVTKRVYRFTGNSNKKNT